MKRHDVTCPECKGARTTQTVIRTYSGEIAYSRNGACILCNGRGFVSIPVPIDPEEMEARARLKSRDDRPPQLLQDEGPL